MPWMMSSRARCEVVRRDASHASKCARRTVAMVSSSLRMNDSSGVGGRPISALDRQVTASSNHTLSTKVACLTRPSKVVREGTSDWRAWLSVSPSRQLLSSWRCSSRNASNWARSGWSMTSSAEAEGSEAMSGACHSRGPAGNRAVITPSAPRAAAVIAHKAPYRRPQIRVGRLSQDAGSPARSRAPASSSRLRPKGAYRRLGAVDSPSQPRRSACPRTAFPRIGSGFYSVATWKVEHPPEEWRRGRRLGSFRHAIVRRG